MHAYEIYDADTVALQAEAQRLRSLVARAGSGSAAEGDDEESSGMLLELILEELEERAVSDAVLRECEVVFTDTPEPPASPAADTALASESPRRQATGSTTTSPSGPDDDDARARSAVLSDSSCCVDGRDHVSTDDPPAVRASPAASDGSRPAGAVSDATSRGEPAASGSTMGASSPLLDAVSGDAAASAPDTKAKQTMSVVEAAEAVFKAEKRAARRASLCTAEVKGITKREQAMQQAKKRSFAGRKALQDEVFVHKKLGNSTAAPLSAVAAVVDSQRRGRGSSVKKAPRGASNEEPSSASGRGQATPTLASPASKEDVNGCGASQTRRSLFQLPDAREEMDTTSAHDNVDGTEGDAAEESITRVDAPHADNAAAAAAAADDDDDDDDVRNHVELDGNQTDTLDGGDNKENEKKDNVDDPDDDPHKAHGDIVSSSVQSPNSSPIGMSTVCAFNGESVELASQDAEPRQSVDGLVSGQPEEVDACPRTQTNASAVCMTDSRDPVRTGSADGPDDGGGTEALDASVGIGVQSGLVPPDDVHQDGHGVPESVNDTSKPIDYDRELLSDDEFGSGTDDGDDDDDDDDDTAERETHDEAASLTPIHSMTDANDGIQRRRCCGMREMIEDQSLSSLLRARRDKDMCAWADSRSASPDPYDDCFGDSIADADDKMEHDDGTAAALEAGDHERGSEVCARDVEHGELKCPEGADESSSVSYTDLYNTFEDIFSCTSATAAAQKLQQALDKRPSTTDGQNLYKWHIKSLDSWLAATQSSSSSSSSSGLSSDSVVFFIPHRGGSSVNHENEKLESVRESFLSHGWLEQPGGVTGCWNVMWSWSSRVAACPTQLFSWQLLNHFPNARNLTRKDLLSGHLQRHMAVHGALASQSALHGKRTNVFDILPQTFALPKDYKKLCEVMTERQIDIELERERGPRQAGGHCEGPRELQGDTQGEARSGADGDAAMGRSGVEDNIWIMKPVGLSRGRGIFLVDDISTVNFSEPMICQKYISKPLLIKGFKFDLRLYVLVTSFNPLECWLSTLGFARFASRAYSCSPSTIDDNLVHLTNTSVQNETQKPPQGGGGAVHPPVGAFAPEVLGSIIGDEGEGGTKAPLSAIFDVIREMRGVVEAEALWRRIRSIVLTSLFAVEDSIPNSPNCFELFGYDILIDDTMRPWLIEANSSPQLDTPTALDGRIKRKVIHDVANVLQPPRFCRRELARVLNERLGAPGRRGAGSCTKGITMAEERTQINEDVNRVMGGARPRKYGEMPNDPGEFERLAPSAEYDNLCRMKRRR